MHKGQFTNPDGPHRSLAILRRYEPEIQKLISCFPSSLTVTPRDVKASTFVTNFRNSVNLLLSDKPLLEGYVSKISAPDIERLRNLWPSVITFRGPSDSVICCHKDDRNVVLESVRVESTLPVAPSFLVDLDSPSVPVLNALVYLYGVGIFTTPSRLRGVIPDNVPLPPSVVLAPQPDGSFLLA